MDIVGYFLALSNLHAKGGRSPDLQDLSVKIADLGTLANELKNYPEFSPESFKKNRINRVGNVGMYLTNNLLEYCLNGKGNPNDEGVAVTFKYKMQDSTNEDETKPTHHAYLFRKDALSEDLVRPLLKELSKETSPHNRLVVLRQ